MRKIFSFVKWFGDEIARRVLLWVGFIGFLASFMSWLLSHIEPISKYGWAAVVLAGLAAACVVILIASIGLVAWRYFYHATKTPINDRDNEKPPALGMRLNIFQFLTESRSNEGVYKLSLTLKPTQAIGIARIVVIFNRTEGNDSYSLVSYSPAHQMLPGEALNVIVMHYRLNVGTFWGDVDRITEKKTLDDLSKDEREKYVERYLSFSGYYFCRITVQFVDTKEENLNFTVLIPPGDERPCVLTGGADHADYDPNRHIPALQGYA
jgi:hypothetical protein